MQVEKCGVCGRLTAALQTCRLCNRRVCEEHFKHHEGMCSECYSRLSLGAQDTEEAVVSATPFRLFFLGFLLMFVGILVLIAASVLQGGASFSVGSVIYIGPIPIVLGAGPYSFFTILLAVVLTIIGFVVFFWMRKQASRT